MHRGALKSRSLSVCAALLLFTICLAAGAQAADGEFKVITTGRLKTMLDDKTSMVLIDTRTKEEYQEAHIPGAVGIPEKTFDESAALLPGDKNAMLVLYCNGVKCGKSRKAAKKAEAMGYRNIVVYAEGFPVWEEKGLKIVAGPDYAKKIETTKLKPADLKALLDAKKQDLVIVDERDESEFREGRIPSAINIPVETFATRSEILPKEKKIVVYCNSGGRSYNAYRKLMKLAYPDIAQTIFAEWKDAGLPLEK